MGGVVCSTTDQLLVGFKIRFFPVLFGKTALLKLAYWWTVQRMKKATNSLTLGAAFARSLWHKQRREDGDYRSDKVGQHIRSNIGRKDCRHESEVHGPATQNDSGNRRAWWAGWEFCAVLLLQMSPWFRLAPSACGFAMHCHQNYFDRLSSKKGSQPGVHVSLWVRFPIWRGTCIVQPQQINFKTWKRSPPL